jgi:hypothetical protein
MLPSTKLAFEQCRSQLASDARRDMDRLVAKLAADFASFGPAISLAKFTQSIAKAMPSLTVDECRALTFYAGTAVLLDMESAPPPPPRPAGQMALTTDVEAMESLREQYLELQTQVPRENLVFTSVTNVLRTRHDTVKNSIGNIR